MSLLQRNISKKNEMHKENRNIRSQGCMTGKTYFHFFNNFEEKKQQ